MKADLKYRHSNHHLDQERCLEQISRVFERSVPVAKYLWTLADCRNRSLGFEQSNGYLGQITDYHGFESQAELINAITSAEEQTRDLAELAGYTAEQHKVWVGQYFVPVMIAPTRISTYINTDFNTEVISALLERCYLGDGTLENSLLQTLFVSQPLVGMVTSKLLSDLNDSHSGLSRFLQAENRPVAGWYKESVEKAATALENINAIFDRWDTATRSKEVLLREMLGHWRKELIQVLSEAINVLNVFALDRMYYSGKAPIMPNWVAFPRPKGVSDHDLQQQMAYGFNQKGWQLLKDLFDIEQISDKYVQLPFLVSVYDAPRFIDFFAGYLKELNQACNAPGRAVSADGRLIRLNNTFALVCRPEHAVVNGRNAQARIGIEPVSSSQYRDFNVRVDRDNSGRMGFDFGGLQFERAVECAQLQAQTFRPEKLPVYSALVNANGQLKAGRKDRGPKVGKLPYKDMTNGEHNGLLAGVFATMSATTFLRSRFPVSHHLQEFMGGMVSAQDFKEIVTGFRRILLAGPKDLTSRKG